MKKLVTLGLAAVIGTALVTGCQKKEEATTTTTTTEQQPAVVQETGTTATATTTTTTETATTGTAMTGTETTSTCRRLRPPLDDHDRNQEEDVTRFPRSSRRPLAGPFLLGRSEPEGLPSVTRLY